MINRESGIPIYIQIQEQLEDMLQDGTLKPNDLVPSENEMSERLMVSRLTVRKSYSEMVKRGLFYTIQGKGTYVMENYKALTPAGNSDKKQRVIGVILPETGGFFGEIFNAIKSDAEKAGYSVILMFNDEILNEITAIKEMTRISVAGIIIAPSRNANTIIEHYQKLINSGIPIVMVGRPPFKITADSVYCDDVFAAYRSVEYLIEHENKRIGYVTSSEYTDEANSEREMGYRSALKDYLPSCAPVRFDISDAEFPKHVESALSDAEPITAFFCFCDSAALALYAEVKRLKKAVPGEVEIIGYDDVVNTVAPDQQKLSSVNQGRERMGRHAFLLLKAKLDTPVSDNCNHHVVVQPRLVLRETTRKS